MNPPDAPAGDRVPGPDEVERLRALYSAKVRTELADADAAAGLAAPGWSGEVLARVTAVKGVLGEAERGGGEPLSGADGEALRKALAALGEDGAFAAVLSRPKDVVPDENGIARLRTQLAALDPAVLIALDGEAAEDVANAWALAPLKFGVPVFVRGTTVVALDGFEAALADDRAKARVWRQLRALRSSSPPAVGRR